jgi:hypothetical protein
MHMQRMVHWRGLDQWRSEATEITFRDGGIAARGVQVGVDPMPYRLDYELDATDGFVTRSLSAETSGEGWSRSVQLERHDDGSWSCRARSDGEVALTRPGGSTEDLDNSLDCDLGFSPLTNLMPIRRLGLDRSAGAADFVMAWVSVPDLQLFASPQRYEHVRTSDSASIVRFLDRGRFEGFTADLRLDGDGIVIEYPGLATRVEPGEPPESSRIGAATLPRF